MLVASCLPRHVLPNSARLMATPAAPPDVRAGVDRCMREDGTSAGVRPAHLNTHVTRMALRWLAPAFFLTLWLTGGVRAQTPSAPPAAPMMSLPGQTGSLSATPNQTTLPTMQSGQRSSGTQSPGEQETNADRGRDDSSRRSTGLAETSIVPDRPTEFQLLVQVTTGQMLPIFGQSLFSGVPSTFAPVDDVPVTPDYVIGPGDQLRLQTWGQVNQQGTYTVDRTGSIQIPQVGNVHVAGLRFSEITSFLQAQLGRVYRNFDLNVNMGQLRSIQVFVVGQARRPGSYTIGSLSTLLNALFASGGPTSEGSLRDIQVRRGSEVVTHFDLYDLLLHGDKSKDVLLQPGDVIFIPPVGPQAALLGSVNTPGIYELRGETRVAQLLQLAGGRTSVAAGSTVRIDRIAEHAARVVVDVDVDRTPDALLQSGDVVSVSAIVNRFKNAVTLRGNVANPGRMCGTRECESAICCRTRRRWSRATTGRSATSWDRWCRSTRLRLRRGEGALGVQKPLSNQEGRSVPPPGAANVPAGAGTYPQGTSLSFPATQPGASSVGAALTGTNSVFGAKTDVILSAPDIDWSYAVIERQSSVDLKTSLLPFDLGAVVLRGDASQNLELLAGDVVTIFSTADVRVPTSQQTRFVRLEGEFQASGVYSVLPGERLRGLLARAGGFTPNAYLYGSEFTRESTRRAGAAAAK